MISEDGSAKKTLANLSGLGKGEIVHLLISAQRLLVPCKTPPAWTTTEIVLKSFMSAYVNWPGDETHHSVSQVAGEVRV